jgi:hypothetical protein
MYQDDEFGLEVQRGAEDGLKSMGMTMVETTTFKRGATDFSSQMSKLKAANCDMVVLGTIIRETIGGIGTARKLGFNPIFLGSSAAYTDLIHKLGGKAMDGLYATMTVQNPYLDDASQPIRFWANKYKTAFNEDPAVFSVYGYLAIDSFIRVAQKAGTEPEHRQLHQGHGHHGNSARHLWQCRTEVRPAEAPGQQPLARCHNCMTAAGPSCRTTLPNEFAAPAALLRRPGPQKKRPACTGRFFLWCGAGLLTLNQTTFLPEALPALVVGGVDVLDAVALDLEGRGDEIVVHRPGRGHQHDALQLLMGVKGGVDTA